VSQVRVHNFSVSLDGFGTGAGQSLETPFGHAGTRLHEWFFPTRTFRAMQGQPGGSTGVDDAFARAWGPGIGAEIMGRGKFGPHHGPWPDQEWTGWGGDTPPFGTPVFVLTHHPRDSRRHGRAGGRAPAKAVQHLMIVCGARSGRRRESAGQRRCWHGRPSASWSN
jgi:hypothetical protein